MVILRKNKQRALFNKSLMILHLQHKIKGLHINASILNGISLPPIRKGGGLDRDLWVQNPLGVCKLTNINNALLILA